MSEPVKRFYEFGPFRIDAEKRVLLREGEAVPLAPKAFDTLLVLVQHHGEVLEKDELMQMLWPDSEVEEGNLPLHISALRKALGESPNERRYIVTVPGRGYRFAADVDELDHGSPDLVVAKYTKSTVVNWDQESSPDNANRFLAAPGFFSDRRKLILASLTVAAVLIVLGSGLWFLLSEKGESQPPLGAIKSLAVLPFANGSGDPDLEYLSDGVSESLIDRLSQLPGVKVIARSSSFKYKGKEVDPREAAKALGVEGLVMGRVVQRGDDLQVRAELVDTRDGTQVWGEQYARRAADIQAVQEEISRTISEKLRLRLTVAQEQQLTRHATQNPQAYQLYLNGLYHIGKGRAERARRALDYYNQAVALDPTFALAWAGVANAYFGLAGNSVLDPKDALPKAKAAAHRALELDETMAEAHSLLAAIKQDEWDWAGAERGHKRAVELNPNLAEAHHRYARYLSVTGQHTAALAEVKRAQGLDPLRVGLRVREGVVLYLARRYDEAIEKLRNVIELEPDHSLARACLGYAYDAKGMYEQAIGEYQKVEREITNAQICLGYALAKSGRRNEALAILNKLKNTKEYVSPTELAVLYIGLGDIEGAIAALERAYAARDLQMQYLKVVPYYDSLRSDPRFQDLMRRVGLPQ